MRRTGFAMLDRLLKRLQGNKEELLVVLDQPQTLDIPQVRRTTCSAASYGAMSAAAHAAM
jgi:hypothetical protein